MIQEARFATLLQKLGQEKIINIVTLALAVSWYAEITKAADQVSQGCTSIGCTKALSS